MTKSTFSNHFPKPKYLFWCTITIQAIILLTACKIVTIDPIIPSATCDSCKLTPKRIFIKSTNTYIAEYLLNFDSSSHTLFIDELFYGSNNRAKENQKCTIIYNQYQKPSLMTWSGTLQFGIMGSDSNARASYHFTYDNFSNLIGLQYQQKALIDKEESIKTLKYSPGLENRYLLKTDNQYPEDTLKEYYNLADSKVYMSTNQFYSNYYINISKSFILMSFSGQAEAEILSSNISNTFPIEYQGILSNFVEGNYLNTENINKVLLPTVYDFFNAFKKESFQYFPYKYNNSKITYNYNERKQLVKITREGAQPLTMLLEY